MGLKGLFISIIILCSLPFDGSAAWIGPESHIENTWGDSPGLFGFVVGETSSTFPFLEAVLPDSAVVVSDIVNKKQMLFSNNGLLLKEVKWTLVKDQSGEEYYEISEYSFGDVIGISKSGNLFTESGEEYYETTLTGDVIRTYVERPLEAGQIKEDGRITNDMYKVTITYPDKEWTIVDDSMCSKYYRDTRGKLYCSEEKYVAKYNDCGLVVAELTLPDSNVKVLPSNMAGIENTYFTKEEYGNLTIAPNGDLYAWKRTPETYSIVKWTWQDDSSDPAPKPNPPRNLNTQKVDTGLKLEWWTSFQDPGCVTGYEISRGDTSGGPYTSIGTVDKGVVEYIDTTVAPGTTYFYVIRAQSGTEYSAYSNEVTATR